MMSQVPAIRPATLRDADLIVARHTALYARDEGFDASFGALVARIVDGFFAGDDLVEQDWVRELAPPLASRGRDR